MDAASNGSLASRDSPSVHSSVDDASPSGMGGGGEYNTDGGRVIMEGDRDGPMDLTSTGNSTADLGAMSDVFLRSQWGSHKKLVGIRFLFPPIDESTNLLERARIWVSRHDYKYFVDWTEGDLETIDPVLRPLSVITRDIYKLHMNRSEYCRNVKLKYCLQSPAAWAQAFRDRLMKSATEGGFTGLCQAKIAAAELWRSYSEHYRSHQARRPNNIKTHRGITDSDITTSDSPTTVHIKSDPVSVSDMVEETSFERECTSCDVLPNGDDDKLTSHALANGGVWEMSEDRVSAKGGKLYKQIENKEEKTGSKQLDSMLRSKNEQNRESGNRNLSDTGARPPQTNIETRELNESFYLRDEENDNEADGDGDGDDDEDDEDESNKGINLCRRSSNAANGEMCNFASSQKEKTRSEISAFGSYRSQDHQRRTPNNIPEMIVTPNFQVKMEVQSFADRMNCWNMTSPAAAAAANLAPVLYGMPLAAYYANPMACLLNPSAATSLRQLYESYLPSSSAAVISPPAPPPESIEPVTPLLSYKKSTKHRSTNRASHNTAAGSGGGNGAVAGNGTTELSSEYRRSERGLSFLFPSFSDHSMSLIDKVRITIARHKNNYFLGWDEAALARLDPLVRPKMAVTPEIYKEYCHRNAMKYDSNLQFAMESEEPWADEFRAKLSLQPCDGGFSSLCEHCELKGDVGTLNLLVRMETVEKHVGVECVKLEAGRLWREYSGKYRMHNIVKWQMDMNNSGDVTSSTASLARNERLRKHSRRVRGGMNSAHLLQSTPLHGNYSGNHISPASLGNFCAQSSSALNYATDANRNHLTDKNLQVSMVNDDVKKIQMLTSSTTTEYSSGGTVFCVTSPSSISLGGREFSREEVRIRASRSLDNSPLSSTVGGLGGAVLTPEVCTAPLDRRSLSSSSVITTVTSPDIDVFNPTFTSAVHDSDQTAGVLTTPSKSPNSHKVLHQDHAMFPIIKGGLSRHDLKYNNNSKLTNESSTSNKGQISRAVIEDSLFAPLPFDLPVCEQICIWLERHRNGYYLGHSEDQLKNLDFHLRPRQVVTPDIFRQNIPESIVDVLSKIDAMMTPSNLNGFYGESWARRFCERVLCGENEGGFTTFEEALTEAVRLWHVNAEGKSPLIINTAESGTTNSSMLMKRSWVLDQSLSKLPFSHEEIKRQRLDEKARHNNNIDDENNEIDCKTQDVRNGQISGVFEDIKNSESTSLEAESPSSLPYKRSLLDALGHDGSKLKRARSKPIQSSLQDGQSKSVDSHACSTASSLDRKTQILWSSRAELYLLCADSPSTSWAGRLAPFLTTLRAAITPDYEIPTTSTMCTVDLILALLHERFMKEDSQLSAPDAVGGSH